MIRNSNAKKRCAACGIMLLYILAVSFQRLAGNNVSFSVVYYKHVGFGGISTPPPLVNKILIGSLHSEGIGRYVSFDIPLALR